MTQIGSYTKQTVSSGEGDYKQLYGYQNGQFVRAATGTLNPFRTMFNYTGTTPASAYTLSLDGETTGIITIDDDQQLTRSNAPVDVYDASGHLVRQQVSAITSLRSLPAGVYVINKKKYVVR